MRNFLLSTLIVISIILGESLLTRGHEWGDDFASYIMQAQSIVNNTTDQFVEHNSFTIFESSNQIGPIAYPWGYPLILAPVYAIKGIHPLALKLPGLLFYVGFLVCLFMLFKTRVSKTESLLAVSLFAFNPLLLKFLDQILSDIPFLFFSTLVLLLIAKLEKRKAAELVLIGIAIFLSYFIRTTGLVLLISFIAVEFLDIFRNRHDRESWHKNVKNILIVTTVFGVLFMINILLFPEGEISHLARYQEFQLATAVQFTGSYFFLFRAFFGEGIIWQIVYYILILFFLAGIWVRRKQDVFFLIFFISWMLLIVTWPSWQGERFIFPLLPIFVYFTFQGINFLLTKVPDQYTRVARQASYGLWTLIAVMFLFQSGMNAYTNLKDARAINGPFDPYSKEVYKYIREQTPADSIIVFFKPRAMHLMTNHDSIMSTECDRVLKGDYLVLNKKVGANQQIPPEQIGDCHLPLREVLQNMRFVVYAIKN